MADDDVAVPDIPPTAGPNQPRAKPYVKKVSKPSGNTPTPVPGRANQDKHWRSNTNRDQTRQKYIESAQANEHSPGKGPSHSEGIMTAHYILNGKNAILIMLHQRSTVALININVTDLSPMISPRKSFLANLATHPRSGL